MPLDLTVLLRSTTSSCSFTTTVPLVQCANMVLTSTHQGGNQSQSQGQGQVQGQGPGQGAAGCRRVATFPMVSGGYSPQSLLLTNNLAGYQNQYHHQKWASESASLHKTLSAPADFFNYDPHPADHSNNCKSNNKNNNVDREKSRDNKTENSSSKYFLRQLDQQQQQEQLLQLSPSSKLKKHVAFADDRGLELARVRVMTEASDVPPKIDYAALMRSLFGDQWVDDEAVAKPCATWVLEFKQPASDYLAFRKKLERNMVAVENVIVRNDHCRLVGTLKVRNVCFEKQVFARFTDNDWKSYYDRPCKYLASKGSCGSTDAYDTFQFDFEIPCDDSKHQRMELVVCYRTGAGEEFWDNNEGKNFEIISQQLRLQRVQMAAVKMVCGGGVGVEGERGTTKAENGSSAAAVVAAAGTDAGWTEFTSWNNPEPRMGLGSAGGGPYW